MTPSPRVIRDSEVPRLVCARGCGRRGVDMYGCRDCPSPPLPTTPRHPGTSTALPDEAYDRLNAFVREQRERDERRRAQDPVARILANLGRHRLPVVALGIPSRVGSLCLLCGAGMRVLFA